VECRAGAEDSGVESRARAFFFLLINEVGRPVAQQAPSEAEEVPDAVQLSRGTMVGPSVSRSPDLRPKNRIDLAKQSPPVCDGNQKERGCRRGRHSLPSLFLVPFLCPLRRSREWIPIFQQKNKEERLLLFQILDPDSILGRSRGNN